MSLRVQLTDAPCVVDLTPEMIRNGRVIAGLASNASPNQQSAAGDDQERTCHCGSCPSRPGFL